MGKPVKDMQVDLHEASRWCIPLGESVEQIYSCAYFLYQHASVTGVLNTYATHKVSKAEVGAIKECGTDFFYF